MQHHRYSEQTLASCSAKVQYVTAPLLRTDLGIMVWLWLHDNKLHHKARLHVVAAGSWAQCSIQQRLKVTV